MKKVLSLDLGITTGWCVRFLDGELMAFGTLKFETEDSYEKALTELILRYLPSYVIAEAPVLIARGELQGKLASMIAATKRVIRQRCDWVTPNEWKPKYGRAHLPLQFRGSTTHEKDAYRISDWWLKTKGALL